MIRQNIYFIDIDLFPNIMEGLSQAILAKI